MCGERKRRSGRRRGRRGGARLLDRARLGDRRVARHPLLQQQLRRLHARIGVEAPTIGSPSSTLASATRVIPWWCAMKVRTAIPPRAPSRSSERGSPPARVRVVDGVVEPVGALEPLVGEPAQVARRALRVDHRGERRRVRRDDQLVAQAALEAEAGDAEGLVLVVAVAIDERCTRTPRCPRARRGRRRTRPGAHRHAAGLVEQRLRIAPHDQQRHQVLEERARSTTAASARRATLVTRRPRWNQCVCGTSPSRDGDEARQPRLGGQQVVEGGSRRPGPSASARR